MLSHSFGTVNRTIARFVTASTKRVTASPPYTNRPYSGSSLNQAAASRRRSISNAPNARGWGVPASQRRLNPTMVAVIKTANAQTHS